MDIREQYAQGKISAYAVLDELDAKTALVHELENRSFLDFFADGVEKYTFYFLTALVFFVAGMALGFVTGQVI